MSEVLITINGIPLEGFEANSIQRNLDSVADGFTFTGPYDPDSVSARLIEPPQKLVTLSIDGITYVSGLTEKWSPGFEKNSTVTQVECRTRAGAIAECTSTAQTISYENQTLLSIANAELAPFGIGAIFPNGDSPPIAQAQRCPADPILSFLKKMACNYEFVINSTLGGNVQFMKPGVSSQNVGSLIQGQEPLLSIDVSFDYSKRYSEYTATGQFPGTPDAMFVLQDPSAEQYRPILFKSDAKDKASLEKAAKWRLSRTLTSVEISATVDGWRNPQGGLWMENQLVTVQAPNVYLFEPYEYLVKNVVLDKSEGSGETTQLTLVMKESFTGDFPRLIPWER